MRIGTFGITFVNEKLRMDNGE